MNILSSLFHRAEKRRVYSNLLQFDDHLLRDIGINRSDLFDMMAGARTAHPRGNRANA